MHGIAGAHRAADLLITTGLGHRRILFDTAVATRLAHFLTAPTGTTNAGRLPTAA